MSTIKQSVAGCLAIAALVSVTVADGARAQDPNLPPGIVSKEHPKTFMEAVWKINATPAFFAALAEQPDTAPTINLNFLRYRPRGDGSRYGLYGAAAGEGIIGVGGDIIYHAEGITDMNPIFGLSQDWDGVAYAMYPRRASYLQLQRDTAYQAAIPDRVAGNYERMLYVLTDGEAIYNATGSIANFLRSCTRVVATPDNVVISEFLRFKEDGGLEAYAQFAAAFQPILEAAGGEVVLSVRAEMPIVSEEYWDHFVSFTFPSKDAMTRLFQGEAYNEINAMRLAALDGNLAVLSTPQIMPAKPCP